MLLPIAWADDLASDSLLQSLQEWTSHPPAMEPASREARKPVLAAIQQEACSHPDDALVLALCRYQLANLDPDFDVPARVLGQIYLQQSETVLAVMQRLPGVDRLRLWPYLSFGWSEATADKNKSLPRLVQLQKKLDRYSGSLMNAAGEPGSP